MRCTQRLFQQQQDPFDVSISDRKPPTKHQDVSSDSRAITQQVHPTICIFESTYSSLSHTFCGSE